MVKNKYTVYTLLLGILLFISIIIIDQITAVKAYTTESIIFIIILLFCYKYYNNLNLNLPTFILLIFSLALHTFGVFDWYNISPLPIQWDHITHFFPIMVVTIIFFNYLTRNTEDKLIKKNLALLLISILIGLGCGSAIENIEFIGFNLFGFGEGGLRFGTGDGFPGQEVSDQIEMYIGGWFNTMWDLIYNLLGSLFGAFIAGTYKFYIKKQKVYI